MMQCASKTFIVGEYAVLQMGPAILFVHPPAFTAEIALKNIKPMLHPKSPAGMYLLKFAPDLFSRFVFNDPHQKKGGYGASSAEFLLAYCHVHQLTLPLSPTDAWKARDAYLAIVEQGSGVDVIAQSQLPGIYYIHPEKKIIESLPWLFTQLALVHQHTGFKTTTHTHLTDLPVFDSEPLIEIVERTRLALLTGNEASMIENITCYQQALSQLNLVHPSTQILLQQQALKPNIFACKGCGALGSDVLLSIEGVL